MKRYFLVFETGALEKTIYPLVETITIGRGSNNLIPLPHAIMLKCTTKRDPG